MQDSEVNPLAIKVGYDRDRGKVEINFGLIDPELFEHICIGLATELCPYTGYLRVYREERVVALMPKDRSRFGFYSAWVEQALELILRGSEFVIERCSAACHHAVRLPSQRTFADAGTFA